MALLTWAQQLWLFSLLLVVVALAIMVGLVLGRLVSGSLSAGREKERKRWLKVVLADAADEPTLWTPASRSQLADLSTELIQLVRGSDRDAFIARAEQLRVPELLRHRLDSGSPRVRVSAAEALSQFPDPKSVERLHAALDDSNADVRLSAALSLALTGNAPPSRELIAKLGIGIREHSRLVVALFREIARVRPDEVRALIGAAEVPTGAKASAIEALSASGDYQLVPMITDLVLSSPADSPELPRFLRALADFAHPAAEPAVSKALSSPRWEARAAAARASGRIGLSGLAPELQGLLHDPEWWVRFRAGEALVRFGKPGVERLRSAIAASDEPAASAAASTLAERGLA